MSLATDAIYRNKFEKINAIQHTRINAHSYKMVTYMQKLHHFCAIHTSDNGPRLAQDWAKSTRAIINYGRFINQFLPDIIKSIRQKICRQKYL